ncbi:DinB family protein [Domibacillus indicus]|uniref:DinB family protein n=1 Tax=Domibacillus indicus TaxID=1437523 RepID=UPI000617BE42|nr:DinB family protein [Domibacillus indicus]
MQNLYDYHAWANEQMLGHILQQFPDVFTKPATGPFSSIARTFEHIYEVDKIWFSRMAGKNLPPADGAEFTDVQQAKEAFNSLSKQISSFLRREPHGNKMICYKDLEGNSFQNTLSELVTHIVNHGTSHRGNIVVMLREAGYRSCPTDYIYFLRR